MDILRILFSPPYKCNTEKSLSERSVTIGAKNVGISHRLNVTLANRILAPIQCHLPC